MEHVESYKDGFLVELYTGEVKWLVPYISHFKTDWPEGQGLLNLYLGPGTSFRNCRCCRIKTKDIPKTRAGLCAECAPREQERTERLLKYWNDKVKAKEYGAKGKRQTICDGASMHPEPNGFVGADLWANHFGCYGMFPFDVLHTISQGIVPILKDILLAYVGESIPIWLGGSGGGLHIFRPF